MIFRSLVVMLPLATTVMAIPVLAQAPIPQRDGFVIENKMPISTAAMNVAGTTMLFGNVVTHIGTKDTKASILKGFARDLPFVTALRQVVPDGWSAFESGGLKLPATSAWRGGMRWYDVLEEMLRPIGLLAEIDWTSKRITLRKASSPFEASSPPEPPAISMPAPVLVTPGRFKLDASDGTVKTAIKRWADNSNWRVIWEASDYRFDVTTDFSGDFDSAICAVLKGINQANAADAKQRTTQRSLDAMFFSGSKIVRIFEVRGEADVPVEATGGRCFPKGV